MCLKRETLFPRPLLAHYKPNLPSFSTIFDNNFILNDIEKAEDITTSVWDYLRHNFSCGECKKNWKVQIINYPDLLIVPLRNLTRDNIERKYILQYYLISEVGLIEVQQRKCFLRKPTSSGRFWIFRGFAAYSKSHEENITGSTCSRLDLNNTGMLSSTPQSSLMLQQQSRLGAPPAHVGNIRSMKKAMGESIFRCRS